MDNQSQEQIDKLRPMFTLMHRDGLLLGLNYALAVLMDYNHDDAIKHIRTRIHNETLEIAKMRENIK